MSEEIEPTSSQYTFNDYLNSVDNDVEYIHVDRKLYGVLDLSILDINHKNVNHIYLGEGNITEIKNYPESLKKFECAKNLLSSLLSLPSGIIEIDVSHNMITMLDVKPLIKLRKLNCSWNRLTSLSGLSDTVTDIIIDNNSISELDLSGLVNLERVDCVNNDGIIVKNVPAGIDLNMDMSGKLKSNDVYKDSYKDVLNKYFKLKREYRNMSNVEPGCVRCKRKGGTIFTKTKDIYYAVCGNSKVCFEIEINTKNKKINNLEDSMNRAKKKVEANQEDIIRHKMDTVFGYIHKQESSDVFMEKAKKYAANNTNYEECLNDFNHIYHNVERDDSIQNEELQMNIYLEEMNEINTALLSSTGESYDVLMHDLVKMQVKVADMNKKLTRLKYEENNVLLEDDKITLNQFVVKFENNFVILDEPEVLKFKFIPY